MGADDASRGFAPGIVAPTELLLEGKVGTRRLALARFERSLAGIPSVASVLGPREQPTRRDLPLFVSPDGQAARFAVVLDRDPLGAEHLADQGSQRCASRSRCCS